MRLWVGSSGGELIWRLVIGAFKMDARRQCRGLPQEANELVWCLLLALLILPVFVSSPTKCSINSFEVNF